MGSPWRSRPAAAPSCAFFQDDAMAHEGGAAGLAVHSATDGVFHLAVDADGADSEGQFQGGKKIVGLADHA